MRGSSQFLGAFPQLPPIKSVMTELAVAAEPAVDPHINTIRQLQENIRNFLTPRSSQRDMDLLEYAFEDITIYHANQHRKSGQPVIIHPLRVAWAICEAGLDAQTVIAALLHDIIEDTIITKEDILQRYGIWYADMVDSLTKITQLDAKGKRRANREATYQKMLASMVKDVRTVFIKLFDRLDNMRDLNYMPRHKQRRISRETLMVYLPMAKRLGLEKISQEYTDLCFQFLYPRRYHTTIDKLKELKHERWPAIHDMAQLLREKLSRHQLVHVDVEPIFVHPADHIHKIEIDKILEGFRVLVNQPILSYQVLGALHTEFQAVPLKIKDFLNNSRWDGYQGLQTEVVVRGEVTFIEITSRQLHALNWHGIMAHWKGTPTELAEYYKAYLEQLDHLMTDKDIRMEEVLLHAQTQQIQLLTPKGETHFFPKGATVLDFAYHIHTELGDTCIGAIVHTSGSRESRSIGKQRVHRERQLFDGESVKILTDPSVRPNRSWLEHVVTHKAKHQIQRYLRVQNALRAQSVGEAAFRQELEKLGEDPDAFLASEAFQNALADESLNWEQFTEYVGFKKINPRGFLKYYQLVDKGKLGRRNWTERLLNPIFNSSKPEVQIEDLYDPLFRFAECCSPIPGDKIFGISTEEQDLEIHRSNCAVLKSIDVTPISVGWNLNDDDELHPFLLRIITVDASGVLFQITREIKNLHVGIVDSHSEAMEQDAIIRINIEAIPYKLYYKLLERLRTLKVVKQILL